MSEEYTKMLLQACENFIEDLKKFYYSMIREEDFRCAIYAEILRVMDKLGLSDYNIRTQNDYGGRLADIALGEKQEVAIELKFSLTYFRPSRATFVEASQQLKHYLANGAKTAYLLYLHHADPEEDVSKKFDLSEFDLTGQWKTIPHNGVIDNLLIATVLKKAKPRVRENKC